MTMTTITLSSEIKDRLDQYKREFQAEEERNLTYSDIIHYLLERWDS